MSEGGIATSGKITDQWEVPLGRDNDGSSYASEENREVKRRVREWEKIASNIAPMVTAASLIRRKLILDGYLMCSVSG